jgi:NADPH:quinone reductase and related Zn-dependent oxidoreductases
VVEATDLARKPAGVSWDVAGALFVAGTTAWAAVRAVALDEGDIVVVSGAAGGVGSLAVQLAEDAGATVIGLASEANHEWLTAHGVIPVAYGDGMAERIRTAASGRIDAFIDTYGDGYVELALELGVETERIDTIIDFAAVEKYGVKGRGQHGRGERRGPHRAGRTDRRRPARGADRQELPPRRGTRGVPGTRTPSHPRQDRAPALTNVAGP